MKSFKKSNTMSDHTGTSSLQNHTNFIEEQSFKHTLERYTFHFLRLKMLKSRKKQDPQSILACELIIKLISWDLINIDSPKAEIEIEELRNMLY